MEGKACQHSQRVAQLAAERARIVAYEVDFVIMAACLSSV
jgi:hypothetical protein